MALTASAVHPCVCCRGKRLTSVVVFRAGRVCCNAFPRKMSCRYNSFLFRITRSYSRSKHNFPEILFQPGDESKFLNKVPVLAGYNAFHDFVESERGENQSGGVLKKSRDDFDALLACRRFPSIQLGRSLPVELYDESTHYSEMKNLLVAKSYELFQNAAGMKNIDPDDLYEQWHCLNESLSKTMREKESCMVIEASTENTNKLKEAKADIIHSFPSDHQDVILKNEENLHHEDSSTKLGSESRINMAVLDSPIRQDVILKTEEKLHHEDSSTKLGSESRINMAVLDSPIRRIPGLTSRQRSQLEKSGFHTFRKMLQHFPRTYADLQNAQVGVDDGQYLISVGKVLSSRGIRTRSSFSFLEVVVGCDILDYESQHVNDDVGAGGTTDDVNTGGGMINGTDVKGTKTIYLHLKKYFRGTRFCYPAFLQSIQNKHKEGDVVCVSGKVKSMRTKGHYEIREYSIDVLKDGDDSSLHPEQRPYPIYPSKGGLTPDILRKIIASALPAIADIDPIPKEVTQEFGVLSLRDAYIGIHQPKNVEEADLARKRLIFDEFFYLQLARLYQMLEGLGTQMEKDGLLDKYRKPELTAVYMKDWSNLTRNFLKALPYSLTPSQLSAVSEIIWDLKRPVPMNRLLQGDVGCGKTVVAFLACMEVIGSGYQAAFMVPTELLAIQHYDHLLNFLETMEEDQFKPSVALLTGSTPAKLSRMIRQDIQTGDISMVIGTHSLISENVEFSALRIAVVDEQHRFGVVQRGRFNSKLYYSSINSRIAAANSESPPKGDGHMAPHVLAMSATPIPRTLALALYGDMSLTQITDLPPGRIPVETHIIEGNYEGYEEIYKMMLDELKAEGRVYLVYPIIEQSEQLPQLRAAAADLEVISQRFQDYNCGLLHGKMKSDDKDEALRRFRSGETRILLSTQVIEVGVDVPDASMMIVMNAERFGIAQLHQLRGRVGRGTRKSKCILVASTTSSLNRLKVLEKSCDGFYLANMDLVLRGPGDLLGKKQSGHLPEFPIARLEVDGNILQDAHAAALKILGESHNLEGFPALKAELSLRQPLCLLGD